MKVILLQDVKKLGRKNDVVEVSNGYAQNFLIKRDLAKPATDKNLETLETIKIEKKEAQTEEEKRYFALVDNIQKNPIIFDVKSDENGTIFGSVNSDTIRDRLVDLKLMDANSNIEVELDAPIKKTGEHIFHVRLGESVSEAKVFVR